ncbi:EF-hand domain-containing protein [Limimaricola sp. AA108-03]|uniref:EF-hand domain-containing protein n=1 Tax=Limimaricola sp. AA108-03 TaxID=3425945 RepID=UPI003D7829AB
MKRTAPILMATGLLATPALSLTFAEIDADGSGSLDAAEFANAYPDAPETYFMVYDQNGDGVASPDEVRQASRLLRSGVSVDELDLDEDGELEREEVQHVFSAGAQTALAKFDADRDGTITLDEVRASDDPKGERGRGRLKQAAKDDDETRSERGKPEQRGRSEDRKPAKTRGNSGKNG